MDFNDTPDQAKFREKCRTWLENNAPYKHGSAKMESFANKDILKLDTKTSGKPVKIILFSSD